MFVCGVRGGGGGGQSVFLPPSDRQPLSRMRATKGDRQWYRLSAAPTQNRPITMEASIIQHAVADPGIRRGGHAGVRHE